MISKHFLSNFRSVKMCTAGKLMEIEAALRLACGEGSSLTRSFWYGKFLQLLQEEEIIKHDQLLTHYRTQLTPVSSSETVALSQPMDGDKEKISQLAHAQALSSLGGRNVDSSIHLDIEKDKKEQGITDNTEMKDSLDYRPHMVEALKCLKHSETSLSPNVYDLIINSIQSAPPEHLVLTSELMFLLKDCTLDWDVISLYLNNGNLVTVTLIILKMPVWLDLSCYVTFLPVCIFMLVYRYRI